MDIFTVGIAFQHFWLLLHQNVTFIAQIYVEVIPGRAICKVLIESKSFANC